MRILYGIQCTGNGHITRSIALIQELRKYVHVDVLTSGSEAEIAFPFEVKYKCKGLFYHFGKDGGFNIWKTLKHNNLIRLYKEYEQVPAHLYDMVISDFEPLTAWSAKRSWVYSVGVSNQVTLLHPLVPRPDIISPFAKLFLKYFSPTKLNYGLSYEKLAGGLYYPPIRKEIKRLETTSKNYYVVYLPFYGTERIIKHLKKFKSTKWVVFSKHTKKSYKHKNVQIHPINDKKFIGALADCKGVLCSAGFGTTSEAIYLKKKLMVIPMKNQYEQQCNAFMLKDLGVPVIKSLKKKHHQNISDWLSSEFIPHIPLHDESERLARKILEDYIHHQNTVILLPA